LERFLGGPTPEPHVVERWRAAAAEAVRLLGGDARARGRLLHRAEEVLREVQAEGHAHLSDVLPRGFDQRLARPGCLPGRGAGGGGAGAGGPAGPRAGARREPRRLERADMALRLTRWLAAGGEPGTPESLGEAARDYLAGGSFVDWARSALRAGDPVRDLAD